MSSNKSTDSWIPNEDSASSASKRGDTDKPTRARKTYYLKTDTIEGVERLAEEKDIGVSKLADFLLAQGLELVEQGELELPIRTVTVNELDI
ncbi:MAG: hypothetical protein ABEL51_05065 [Salinibacter sp.]